MRSAPAVSTPARERPPLDGPISAELVGERPLRVSSTGRLARQVPAIAVLAAVRPQLGASPPRLRLHQVLDGEARRGLVLVPLLGSAHPPPPPPARFAIGSHYDRRRFALGSASRRERVCPFV